MRDPKFTQYLPPTSGQVLSFKQITLLLVGLINFALSFHVTILPLSAAAQSMPTPQVLSPETIKDAGKLILSDAVEFPKRVELAASLTFLFEQIGRSDQARLLCLEFYASLTSELLPDDPMSTVPPLEERFAQYAQAIENGKLRDTANQINKYLHQEGQSDPQPVLTLLALKADSMRDCYFALFGDISRRRLSPYSHYVLGILSARESRYVEAQRFMESARNKMQSPILERWLSRDLAKIALVRGDRNRASSIINQLLKVNAQDPWALYLQALSQEKQQGDASRQILARIIPLLYEDPYLISGVATLALELNEVDTAAKILESFETKVDPISDFYKAFALVRKVQNRNEDSIAFSQKAEQYKDPRVSVAGAFPTGDDFTKLMEEERKKNRDQIVGMEDVEPLIRAYLLLFRLDRDNAAQVLTQQIQAVKTNAVELFTLSMIQNRAGQRQEALQSFQALQKQHPDFQPYKVLTYIADLSVQSGNRKIAETSYRDLLKKYPESYQATVAQRYLQTPPEHKPERLSSLQVSSFMSPYTQYSAPFVMTEIMNYWGDRTDFSSVRTVLRTSQYRSLSFNEFLKNLITRTRYKIVFFIGVPEALNAYLRENIPVVFTQGDMFANQILSDLVLLTGGDPARGIYYAEGVTPNDCQILTAEEIGEGLCVAIYPESLSPNVSLSIKPAHDAGLEFIELNSAAAMISKDSSISSGDFSIRRQTIISEEKQIYLPHKLAFLRWTQEHTSLVQASSYRRDIQKDCSGSSHFWFISAVIHFKEKNIDMALEALDRAERREPDNPRYGLSRVRALFNLSRYNDAANLAKRLSEQFPYDPLISGHLIALYQKMDKERERDAEEARLKKLYKDIVIQVDLDDGNHQVN